MANRKVSPTSVRNLKRGGSPGRPKGVPNKATREAKEFASGVLESAEYREWLWDRIKRKKLTPQIETLLWHYAYGKPKQKVEVTGEDGGPISGEIVIREQLGDGA